VAGRNCGRRRLAGDSTPVVIAIAKWQAFHDAQTLAIAGSVHSCACQSLPRVRNEAVIDVKRRSLVK